MTKLLKKGSFFIKFTFLYSIFIIGQRWMVGTDYRNYILYYIYEFQETEWGYRTLQNIFTEYGLSVSLMMFICYLITQINFYKFMNLFGEHTVWIVYFYCLSEIYFAETSQVRQWLAISFFINALYYVYVKKYIKAFIFICIGGLFHSSIYLVIPLLFVRFKSVVKSKEFFIVLFIVLMSLPLINLNFLLPVFSFSEQVSYYMDSRFIESLSYFHYFKYYFLVILTYVYLYSLDISKLENVFGNKNVSIHMVINGQIIYLILYGLSMQLGAFMRFSLYFKIFEIIFLVALIPVLRKISKTQISYAIIIYFLSMFVALSILDTMELSEFQFRLITLFEPFTILELIEEFNIAELKADK